MNADAFPTHKNNTILIFPVSCQTQVTVASLVLFLTIGSVCMCVCVLSMRPVLKSHLFLASSLPPSEVLRDELKCEFNLLETKKSQFHRRAISWHAWLSVHAVAVCLVNRHASGMLGGWHNANVHTCIPALVSCRGLKFHRKPNHFSPKPHWHTPESLLPFQPSAPVQTRLSSTRSHQYGRKTLLILLYKYWLLIWEGFKGQISIRTQATFSAVICKGTAAAN